MNPKYSLRLLLIIAAVLQLVWGLVPSASQFVIDEIPVELYIALRWTISGAIFSVLLFFRKSWRGLFRKEALPVALLGIGGYAIASFCSLYGLKIGGVTNFAMMGTLNPIITAAVSVAVLREVPKRSFYLALPLCVSGLILLVFGKHALSSWTVAFSSLALIMSGAVLEALVFVFSKRGRENFSSLQYLAIAQLSAAAFMWLMQISFFQQTSSIANLSARGWTAAIFVSVVACVLCYLILYWLLNYIDGHRLALFDGLHAVSATLFGYFIFNETMNGLMIFGGLVLLVGLTVGNYKDGSVV